MLKQLAISALLCSCLVLPGYAQNQNFTASPGESRHWADYTGAQAEQGIMPNNGLLPIEPTALPGSTFNTGKQVFGDLNMPNPLQGDFSMSSLLTQPLSCLRGPMLPPTMTTQYGTAPGVITPLNQLPPTKLDSFVVSSGYNDNIYGDEGTTTSSMDASGNVVTTPSPPPIASPTDPYGQFGESNTIGAGMMLKPGPNNTYLSTGHASRLPSAWCTDFSSLTGTEADQLGSAMGGGAGTTFSGALNGEANGGGTSGALTGAGGSNAFGIGALQF